MATFMGYRNYDAVIECSKAGKLSRQSGKTKKLDELAMVMLTYMALRSIDKEDTETQRKKHLPYRTYWKGWDAMISDMGMNTLTDEQMESAAKDGLDITQLAEGRTNTARNRLSRAAKFLEQQGLIRRILKPNITRNQTSVWVLLISPTPEQNLHDLNQALGHFNLPCVAEL